MQKIFAAFKKLQTLYMVLGYPLRRRSDKEKEAQDDVLRFHQFAGDGDKSNDIRMERSGLYSTVSITSILLAADQGSMNYLDLREHKMYDQEIDFTSDCEIL